MKKNIVFLLLFQAFSVVAQLPSIIKENTTLTERGSPYILGETLVAHGAVLTIEAGVEITINFKGKNAAFDYLSGKKMVIEGTIIAKGTPQKPIQIQGILIFKNKGTPSPASVFEYFYLHQEGASDVLNTSSVSIYMKNSTVEGGIYASLLSDNQSNVLHLFQCKLSADYQVLSVSSGSTFIDDCEIYGRSDFYNLSKLQITKTDFKQGAVNNYHALLLDSRSVLIENNSFEGINAAAIWLYFKPNNRVTINHNLFKNNKNHIEIDVKTDLTPNKDLLKWDKKGLSIHDNHFLDHKENAILVTDTDRGSDRVQSFIDVDLGNNYWGNVYSDAVEKAIYDNVDDAKGRVKINFTPIKYAPFYTPKPPEMPIIKPLPTLIFSDTIDPLSILTFKFRDTTLDFHFRKIPKSEVSQWYNMVASGSPNNYRYYTIHHQGRYYMNNYNTPAAFKPNYTWFLGYWGLGFQNLDLDKVSFPLELKKPVTGNEPYVAITFTNTREIITDFSVILNSFENGFLSGIIRGVYHNINGYDEFIDAQFSVRLELLAVKN